MATGERQPMTTGRKAGWVAIAVAAVAGFEGLRTAAYLDPVSVPTICFGETKGVKMGDRATVDECKTMLADSLMEANEAVERCTHTPMSPNRQAALVSFTYNVGGHAYCTSTLVKRINAEDPQACEELKRWVYAKGIKLPGLVKRRDQEERLCES